MTTKYELFNAIENYSEDIINGSNNLSMRIRSAKNYVSNENFDKWAFSKLVATEEFEVKSGARSKPFFYNLGFINILEIEDAKFKHQVINKFLKWAQQVEAFDLRSKFENDQADAKRFELLVHFDQIPKTIFKKENLLQRNYDVFIEGFRREIVREVSFRNQELIRRAKYQKGTTCDICNFNFEDIYGLHGKGFIEMHHLFPISKGERRSSMDDLVPVCANCHRMLHKGTTDLKPEDIKEMIKKSKAIA